MLVHILVPDRIIRTSTFRFVSQTARVHSHTSTSEFQSSITSVKQKKVPKVIISSRTDPIIIYFVRCTSKHIPKYQVPRLSTQNKARFTKEKKLRNTGQLSLQK